MESTELNFGIIISLACGIELFLLVILFLAWLSSLSARSALTKEVEDLKKHLHINMSIHAKGAEEIQKEVDKLKRENENLRITVATMSNKPGRAELKMLHTWDRAIKILILKSPAFAPAWEMAIEEAGREIEETNSGMKALVRKVFSLLPQDSLNENGKLR
jgi:ribosomal protein L29